MASYKFLFDNGVQHLAVIFPSAQTVQLWEVGLEPSASDEAVVEIASINGYIIVTNNRRHFERFVTNRIAESAKNKFGCTQVHGLLIVLPLEQIKQERALKRAFQQLRFEGKAIGWKDVHDRCLKVIVEESGRATVSNLPRCPHCIFDDVVK